MASHTNNRQGEQQHGSQKPPRKKSVGEIIDNLAKLMVFVITLPIRAMAAIVAQFVGNGGAGKAAVGGILFLLGTAISTDSMWQTLFRQQPLFPWFESNWVGWWGWALVVVNPFFYLAFFIAIGVQVIEAYSLRGKNPDTARRDLQDVQQYDLEPKPSNKIDLAQDLWKDYKKAGVRDHKTAGLVALSLWMFDLIITFSARNPWQYSDPATIIQCLIFNVATMMAGEIGFTIWKLTKD